MGFDWTKLGCAPEGDTIEITTIGPGYGESIVIHVGNNEWIVVDSCVDTAESPDRTSAALRYLRAIGINPSERVRLVVATHWHDDHVRGISQVVEASSNATFSCSSALTESEFIEFVEEMSTQSVSTDGAKVREMRQVIRLMRDRGQTIRRATGSKILAKIDVPSLPGTVCQINALSPSDKEFDLFMQRLGGLRPGPLETSHSAPRAKPNLTSVVLSIEWGHAAILLGSDMESHRDLDRGWNAVVTESKNMRTSSASVVKVPHHGGESGHHAEMWSELLQNRPIAVLTPFNRLAQDQRLPTDLDIARVGALAEPAYITSKRFAKKLPPRDKATERGLRENGIEVRSLEHPLGIVRLRKTLDGNWQEELFGAACELRLHAA